MLKLRIGLFLLSMPVALAGASLLMSRDTYTLIDLSSRLDAPTLRHPLGTDDLGRDVLARSAVGARVSLTVGLAVAALCAAIGAVAGCVAGYLGGAFDRALAFATDLLLSFPGLLLAIALLALLGPGLRNLVAVLVVTGWTGYARLSRSLVMSLHEAGFLEAQRAIGSPIGRVLIRHLLPNIAGPLVAQTALGVPAVILAEGALGFLGLGAQPPEPTWGAMIAEGRRHVLDDPLLMVAPGLALFLTLLGLSLVGEVLSARFDLLRRSRGE